MGDLSWAPPIGSQLKLLEAFDGFDSGIVGRVIHHDTSRNCVLLMCSDGSMQSCSEESFDVWWFLIPGSHTPLWKVLNSTSEEEV